MIVADNDAAGPQARPRRRRETGRDSRHQSPIVVAAEGKDAADHLAAGHGLGDLVPLPAEK